MQKWTNAQRATDFATSADGDCCYLYVTEFGNTCKFECTADAMGWTIVRVG